MLLQGQTSKVGTALCYKASTSSDLGVCVLFSAYSMGSLAGCNRQPLGAELLHVKTGICLGTHERLDMVRHMVGAHACFTYPCAQNMMLPDASPRCVQVTVQETTERFYRAVWADTRGVGGRRRLLLDAGAQTAYMTRVASFVIASEARIDSIPDGDACKEALRACTSAPGRQQDCALCGAQWLFWNLTLQGARGAPLDTGMFEPRAAIVHLLLSPGTAAVAFLNAPHAVLVLFEDWLQNTAAFERVLWHVRAVHAAFTRAQQRGGGAGTVAPALRTLHSSAARVPPATQRRRLLQDAQPAVVISAPHADFTRYGFLTTPNTPPPLLYQLKVLQMPVGLNCIVSKSTLVNNVAYDIIRSFEREGWTAKPICTSNVDAVTTASSVPMSRQRLLCPCHDSDITLLDASPAIPISRCLMHSDITLLDASPAIPISRCLMHSDITLLDASPASSSVISEYHNARTRFRTEAHASWQEMHQAA